MSLNENIIKGKWLEIKGEVRKMWGKITDDELEQTKGDVQAIGGLIQQKYGETQDKDNAKLKGLLNQFQEGKDKGVDKIKNAIKN